MNYSIQNIFQRRLRLSEALYLLQKLVKVATAVTKRFGAVRGSWGLRPRFAMTVNIVKMRTGCAGTFTHKLKAANTRYELRMQSKGSRLFKGAFNLSSGSHPGSHPRAPQASRHTPFPTAVIAQRPSEFGHLRHANIAFLKRFRAAALDVPSL